MNIKIYENHDIQSKKVSEYIINFVKNKPDALLCLAGGHNPLKTYVYLINAYKSGEVSFSECKFVGLGEWVGLAKDVKGSCYEMLYNNLFSKLNLREEQICFFDGITLDLEEECNRVNNFIFENERIDLILLGVGMNGHLGFNEPNINPDLYCTVVQLDEITTTVGQKYFNDELVLNKGITLGLKHIFESKNKIIMANGLGKAEIISKIINKDKTNEIPASLLVNEEGCSIFLDKEAASKL